MLIFPVVVTLAGGRPRDCSSDRRRARLRLAIACLKVEAKVLGAQSLGHILRSTYTAFRAETEQF